MFHLEQIRNKDDKKSLITYLYDSVDINRLKYILMNKDNTFDNHLKHIKSNKEMYNIMIHYNGNNMFLIFKYFPCLKKNLVVMIDRKTLTFDTNMITSTKFINNVSIFSIIINHKFNKDLFNGTIIDGKLTSTKNKFIVYNILSLNGISYAEKECAESFNMLKSSLDVLWLKFPQIYTDFNILRDDTNFRRKVFQENDNNGFVFIPKIPGIQYIFQQNLNKVITQEFYMFQPNKDVYQPDVYKLVCTSVSLEDIDFNTKSYELAYIKNSELSIKCYNFFQSDYKLFKNKFKYVTVTCSKDTSTGKFVPLNKIIIKN